MYKHYENLQLQSKFLIKVIRCFLHRLPQYMFSQFRVKEGKIMFSKCKDDRNMSWRGNQRREIDLYKQGVNPNKQVTTVIVSLKLIIYIV